MNDQIRQRMSNALLSSSMSVEELRQKLASLVKENSDKTDEEIESILNDKLDDYLKSLRVKVFTNDENLKQVILPVPNLFVIGE